MIEEIALQFGVMPARLQVKPLSMRVRAGRRGRITLTFAGSSPIRVRGAGRPTGVIQARYEAVAGGLTIYGLPIPG